MADLRSNPARAAVAPVATLIRNTDGTSGRTAVKLGILLGRTIFRRQPMAVARLSTAYSQKPWPT
jgi:hypothetical protein